MKRRRHNPEQIIRKLRSAEQLLNQGQAVADVCRALEVSAPTYYRWQQQWGSRHTDLNQCSQPRQETLDQTLNRPWIRHLFNTHIF